MACPENNKFYFSTDNLWLKNWAEKFYISIIESNFLINLHKYKKIFELLSIFIDIAEFNIISEKEKYFNKLSSLESQWKNNELSIKNIETELKRKIFELKEEKMDYKIIIMFSEILLLIKNKNQFHLKDDFLNYKNKIIENLLSNKLSKLEKQSLSKNLEKTIYELFLESA
jgi:hypothetical protein